MATEVDVLLNNASVVMTFMQRGWTDVNEMRQWLIEHQDLSFDDLILAIPTKNDKDDYTNFGEHITAEREPVPTEDCSEKTTTVTLKQPGRHSNLLLIFILIAAILFLIFFRGFGFGNGDVEGSGSGGTGGSYTGTITPVTTAVTTVTTAVTTESKIKPSPDSFTITGNTFTINGKEYSSPEKVVEYIVSKLEPGKTLLIEFTDNEGIINAYDKLEDALHNNKNIPKDSLIVTFKTTTNGETFTSQLYP